MGHDVKVRKLLGYAVLSITLFGLLNWGFMLFNQENMIFYPEVLPQDFKFDHPGHFEEINLAVNGATINALHFKTAQPKGIVLYFHGNAGSLNGWGFVAPDFTRRGYDIVIPDYRGFGKSTGRIASEHMLLEDAQTAYAYVKSMVPEDRIMLYGRSIGTGLAVYLARTNRPRLLMLEAPFFSLLDLASYHYPLIPRLLLNRFMKYPLRTDLWISDVACPVYLFHGTMDDIVPFDASRRLGRLIRSNHELVEISKGGHNDLVDFPQYRAALDRILQPVGSGSPSGIN